MPLFGIAADKNTNTDKYVETGEQLMTRFWQRTDNKTKWFYFQWFIYLLALILSTAYAYVRIDFVRTGSDKQMEQKQ